MEEKQKFYRDYRGNLYSPIKFNGPCLYFKTLPHNPGTLRACSRYSCPKKAACLDGKPEPLDFVEPFNVPIGGRKHYTAQPEIPVMVEV